MATSENKKAESYSMGPTRHPAGYFTVTTSNDPVISCESIQINHSFLMSFSSYQEIKFLTRKLKDIRPQILKFLRICVCKWMHPHSTDCKSLPVTSAYIDEITEAQE